MFEWLHPLCRTPAATSRWIEPQRPRSAGAAAEQFSGPAPCSPLDHLYFHSVVKGLGVHCSQRDLCSFIDSAADFYPSHTGSAGFNFMGPDLVAGNFVDHPLAFE